MIGLGNAGTTAVAIKGTKISGKGDKSLPGVASFSWDTNKGKGTYQTGLLPATTTGITTAATGGTNVSFATSITLLNNTTALLGIQSGIGLFVKGHGWVAPNPSK